MTDMIQKLNDSNYGRWCGYFVEEDLQHYCIYLSGHERQGELPYTAYVCPTGWKLNEERVRWDAYIGGSVDPRNSF